MVLNQLFELKVNQLYETRMIYYNVTANCFSFIFFIWVFTPIFPSYLYLF